MTDTQLYLAIAVPAFLFAINLLVIVWQAKGIERTLMARIDGLEHVMSAKFDTVDAKFEAQRQGMLRLSKCSTRASST